MTPCPFADLEPGYSRRYETDGHHFRVFALSAITAAPIHRVVCETCVQTLHPGTTAPFDAITKHMLSRAETLGLDRPSILAERTPSRLLTYAGAVRLYFIANEAFPLVWCIATDEWEMAVKSLEIRGVAATSRYERRDPVEHEYAKPSAWFECVAHVTVTDGHAVLVHPEAA